MASLAQYSTTLHDSKVDQRPAPGRAARYVGWVIYAGMAALVVLAAAMA